MRCVVNVTLRPLYPRERTLVPIFWIWPGRYGEEAFHVPLFEPGSSSPNALSRLIPTSGTGAKGRNRSKYDDSLVYSYRVCL